MAVNGWSNACGQKFKEQAWITIYFTHCIHPTTSTSLPINPITISIHISQSMTTN